MASSVEMLSGRRKKELAEKADVAVAELMPQKEATRPGGQWG
ncbi:MAG: hypothetical protein ACYDCI_15230 [Candidatus Limnocylindrales bacterium]